MSRITISNLQPIDLNLSSDSKSYLKNLDESEQNMQGGLAPLVAFVAGFGIGFYGTMAGGYIGMSLAEHLLWKDGV